MPDNSVHHFTIRIAGVVIKVHTMYSRTYCMCKDYICDDDPDFEVTITEEDLLKEQFLATGTNERYMGGYLESTAVYRKIIERAVDYDILLLHGAAIALNNSGYIFSGKSGVGKTTHIKKWLNQNSAVIVINGDKPLIRYINNSFFVCGTPWSGKEYMNTNKMVQLNSIAFMTRNDNNSIMEMDFSDAFPFLLKQTYIHKDPGKLQQSLDLLARMKGRVKFYAFLSNNMKADSYPTAYEALIQRDDELD